MVIAFTLNHLVPRAITIDRIDRIGSFLRSCVLSLVFSRAAAELLSKYTRKADGSSRFVGNLEYNRGWEQVPATSVGSCEPADLISAGT